MPDQDTSPDPMDKAYVQAEAMLDDEKARAARRARVLAAVAREAEAPPVTSAPPKRSSWRRGGWLAAACAAGLSVFVTVRLYPTTVREEQAPPPSAATAPSPETATAPAPAAPSPAARPAPVQTRPPSQARAIPAPAPPPPAPAQIQPRPPAPIAAPARPAEPAAPPAALDGLDEVVITASRAPSPAPPAPQVKAAPSASGRETEDALSQAAVTAARPRLAAEDRGAKLRDAAAVGEVSELRTLLAQGTPVDARDATGETALMKAVQGNQAAAAAFLKRRGASLDLKNEQGRSARDMAAEINDPDLDKALGLGSRNGR